MARRVWFGIAVTVTALAAGVFLGSRARRGRAVQILRAAGWPQTPLTQGAAQPYPDIPIEYLDTQHRTYPSVSRVVGAAAPEEISLSSLLGEMVSLGHLARWPQTPFKSRQTSSTDRRARDPGDAASWFANDDFVTSSNMNLVRVETATDGGKRFVLLDERGPGAVVRIWTATPTGTIRIFIDDDPQPAVEAEMGELLSGKVPPFEPPFGQITAMGYTLYFPFPYRRRCVVTVDSITSTDPFSGKPVDKLYYQIGTRSYPASAANLVRSFSPTQLDGARATIARVARDLREEPSDGDSSRPVHGTIVRLRKTAVRSGSPMSAGVTAPKGGGTVTRLRLFTKERDPASLRATSLSIVFDGEETVRAPLADFFGSGPGWNPYSSLPMQVGADGWLVCRFPMPFRKHLALSVHRAGAGGVEINGDIVVETQPFLPGSLLFHARRRDAESVRTRPFSDWNLVRLSGRGQLVGVVLDVENPTGTAWWGEGDEKIYVDGEAFPSIFGTGTEDYFGYAWSSGALFAHPYHAQTRATGPGFAGQFSMNRWHVLDPIAFQQGLRFDLEAWHWSDTTMLLDGTVYWYAPPEHAAGDLPHAGR